MGQLWPAATLSFTCWAGLGYLAACLAQQPLPATHVETRLKAGELDLSAPLRWHGRLRAERARVPWGYSFDVDLSAVESGESVVRFIAGLRLGFTARESDNGLPELHASNEVTFLAQARLPLVYRDPGAFNRREFLAQQNIHLLASLRASVVGHHGSRNSTMPQFLSAVAPQIGIISAGEQNPYGHPSPELLERPEGNGLRVFRTDRDGAVQVRTDGHNLTVSCFVACPGPAGPSSQAQAPNNYEHQ